MYSGSIWDSARRRDVEQGRCCGFGEGGRVDERDGWLAVGFALLLVILCGCSRADGGAGWDLLDDGHCSE